MRIGNTNAKIVKNMECNSNKIICGEVLPILFEPTLYICVVSEVDYTKNFIKLIDRATRETVYIGPIRPILRRKFQLIREIYNKIDRGPIDIN